MAHVRQVSTLTLEAAKAICQAAEAYANKKKWPMAIAIVNASGGLILYHMIDDTQPASEDIAMQKARTAARLRRPTKALEDAISGGRAALLSVGALALEGGLPIEAGGRVVGGIGVSGMASAQDAEVARAGIAAFKGK